MPKANRHAEEPDALPHAIGAPARRALHAAGITRLTDLTKRSEAELLKWHGIGPKAAGILRQALASQGLAFAAPSTEGTSS